MNITGKYIFLTIILPALFWTNAYGQSSIRLSLKDAVKSAMENNPSILSRRFNPKLAALAFKIEKSKYDPVLKGEISHSKSNGETITINRSINSGVTWQRLYPVGTILEVGFNHSKSWNAASKHGNRFEVSFTRPLKKGAGTDVNLAPMNQAAWKEVKEEYEFRGYLESLVYQIAEQYWNLKLAEKEIEVYNESLSIAIKQLKETEERILIGKLSSSEKSAVEAEIALRKEGLINARTKMNSTRIRLLQLINNGRNIVWDQSVETIDKPALTAGDNPVELQKIDTLVKNALKIRPEINAAKAALESNDLQLVLTRNGLLPKMDLFVRLQKSGYADSFGDSWSNIKGDDYDINVGISFEWSRHRRAEKARHETAEVNKQQANLAIKNLVQIAELDIRLAYMEVQRALEQIQATGTTKIAQKEKLLEETEKYRIGNSTTFIVAQAQRDLLESSIKEFEAILDYQKANVNLHYMDGSLLFRFGVKAPGEKTCPDKL